MRIGLLSPHYAYNYGAVLQAFALKTHLRSRGHDAVILNRRPAYHCAIPSLSGRMARRLEVLSKRRSFGAFERRFLQPQTAPVVHEADWEQLPAFGLDAVVVGSDQVWRDDYAFTSFGYNMFLDFADRCPQLRRIAYAPSLGKESWNSTPEREARVRQLLHKFSAISVREHTSVPILRDKFGVEATAVVDPTLLLDAADYTRILGIDTTPRRRVAAYILDYDADYAAILDHTAHATGMPVSTIGVKSPSGAASVLLNRFRCMTPVTEWVRRIASAQYVVTNSFHGMVFAIIFRKQFVVFMNNERGAARFKSLLGMFGLESRLVAKDSDCYTDVLLTPIDYARAEAEIRRWQAHSAAWLDAALAGVTKEKQP